MENCTAIILAGGNSSRMGTDKGLVNYIGKPLIKHVIDRIDSNISNIIIISKNPAYKKFGYPVYDDLIPEVGPLGGLLTGLHHTSTEWNFLIACDMPYVDINLLNTGFMDSSDFDAVVSCFNKQLEPFNSWYHKNCMTTIKQRIESGDYKFKKNLQYFKLKLVDVDDQVNKQTNPFLNFNSMNEMNNYRAEQC